MTTHKEHAMAVHNLTEEQYDKMFDAEFIASQINLLIMLEYNSLQQKKSHFDITEDELIIINERINHLEQKRLMHMLKYNK